MWYSLELAIRYAFFIVIGLGFLAYFGPTLQHYWHHYLRYMLRHWFPFVLVGIVWAFIWGPIGANFGVPLLFRDDPAYSYGLSDWWWNRPSIAGYTAATVLLTAFLTVVYIFEFADNPDRPRIVLPSWLKKALQTVRIPDHLIELLSKKASAPIRFFAIAGVIPLTLLLAAAAIPWFDLVQGAPECTQENTFCNGGPAASMAETQPPEDIRWAFHVEEGLKALSGVLMGTLIALTCGLMLFLTSTGAVWFGHVFNRWLPRLVKGLGFLFGWMRHGFSETARNQVPIVIGTILTVIVLFFLFLFLSYTDVPLAAMARPGATISIFFGVVVAFYFFVLVLSPSMRFIGVIAFFAMHAFVGADRYINELPGFKVGGGMKTNEDGELVAAKTDYYKCLLPLNDKGHPISKSQRKDCPDHAKEEIDDDKKNDKADGGKSPPLLTAKAWANQWKVAKPMERSRKLVVVATQGGAYRASFWTSLILDELDKKSKDHRLPELTDRIGLMTGASGGMVASAYFTVMGSEDGSLEDQLKPDETSEPADVSMRDCGMNPGGGNKPWTFGPVTSQLCIDVYKAAERTNEDSKFTTPEPIARDSLTPVAAQTVLFDMRRVLFWPLTVIPGFDLLNWDDEDRHDRGLILERQWGTLHKSYSELAELQANRRRANQRHPSMIISPMIADTGQPMLISNLDLNGLVANGSNEAISMFDWFPDIRSDFRVQTAVRMNASFPYISPAVSLPTTVRRRVVDAGYYDNYGVNTAISWLFQEDVLNSLADKNAHIDGLIIIQIRAFEGRDQGQAETQTAGSKGTKTADLEKGFVEASMSSDDDTEDAARDKEKHKADLPLIPEWLTSPLAGVLAARSGSMAYRNDAQIERLRRVLVARGRDVGFVQSVTFENHADTDKVGVSWHITPHELARLESELKSDRNEKMFACLEAFWHDRSDDKECYEAKREDREDEDHPSTITALGPRSLHD